MINEPNKQLVPHQYKSNSSLDHADIVIIGNGIAGLTAAVEARHISPDKRIVIVTSQIHPTINTPALKQFAIGKLTREQLLAYPAGTERAERIHVVHSHVTEIHAQSKYITLSGNRGFGYNSLLIATGSNPQGLPEQTPGRNFDGVLTLHRLQDYLDLRRRLGELEEAVVVGGGVHAIETVMGLLYWGIRVHWLIRGKTFMGRMLDEAASEIVLNNVRKAGAIIHLQTEIAGIVGRVGAVAGVITNHQEMIPCQMVLTCTGTQAATALAKSCSVPMLFKNGIMVDDKLRTSVRDIYAAGDVAALKNPQTGSYEPRAQWYAAVAQGRIAGSMMVGNKELAQQIFGVHWHATHLGELSMLTVGEPLSNNPRIESYTDTSQGGYRRLAVFDDRLVGYLALGAAQPDSLAIKRIIDEGTPVRSVLKSLLKGNFDARSYLSRQRSHSTRNLLTQQLPNLIKREERPATAVQRMPTTDEMNSYRIPRQTDPLALPRPTTPVQPSTPTFRQTGPLGQYIPEQPSRIVDTPILPDDDFNPFTGSLPEVELNVTERSVRRNSIENWGNSPVTPTYNPPLQNYARDNVLAASDKKQLHYKLWSYIDPALDAQDNVVPNIQEGDIF
ncbi:hypothetical protein KDI_39910 [Dictyobacter arantiisoli]|uniref:FAD/NAD(P)-binding domain-containing protein n=1 Tax=Dictyobacter arantiisoli TaxID=2014874 RepID=A0A5A5TGD7_9CHLR|nr:hypothetical protein KDI_39910 [Dictyobacter arantiisoli]